MWVKVFHDSRSGSECVFRSAMTVVHTDHPPVFIPRKTSRADRKAMLKHVEFDQNCPICASLLKISTVGDVVTKHIPARYTELKYSAAAARPRRGAKRTFSMTIDREENDDPMELCEPTSPVHPDDLAWAPPVSHFSMGLRLSPSGQDYDHGDGRGVQATLNASGPAHLARHDYPPFNRSISASTDRDQQKHIKEHYERLRQDGVNSPHIRSARDYSASKVAADYGGTNSPDGKGYQWCHVQADSLGGVNDRSNLFSGSYYCNSFMCVPESVVGNNPADALTVSISLFYQPRLLANGQPNVGRQSSRLVPDYVLYAISAGTREISFLINARCNGFSKADSDWVRQKLNDFIGRTSGKKARYA